MNKTELYNALIDEGENLPPISKITKAELEAIYADRHPEQSQDEPEQQEQPEEPAPETPQGEPSFEKAREHDEFPPLDSLEQQDAESSESEHEEEAEQEPENIPPLHFSSAGWCPALNRSYFIGWFHPVTRAEYEALAPYADGAAK